MSKTKIEWTATTGPDGETVPGYSWNPLRARDKATGKVGHYCELTSPGCGRCYASAFQPRFGLPAYAGEPQRWQRLADLELFLDEKVLAAPLHWKKPRRVFVCSMTDLFGDWVNNERINRIFAVMGLATQHTFQVLTKRAERMKEYLSRPDTSREVAAWMAGGAMIQAAYKDYVPPWPNPSVWCGVSCERQQEADARIPHLLQTPAAVRFLSVEPLLSAVDLGGYLFNRCPDCFGMTAGHAGVPADFRCCHCAGVGRLIDWVICGGESGPRARPMDDAWVRSVRDQCKAAGVPFFLKQKLENGRKVSLPLLDGARWAQFPGAMNPSEETRQDRDACEE